MEETSDPQYSHIVINIYKNSIFLKKNKYNIYAKEGVRNG